jgi:hypothetical protein
LETASFFHLFIDSSTVQNEYSETRKLEFAILLTPQKNQSIYWIIDLPNINPISKITWWALIDAFMIEFGHNCVYVIYGQWKKMAGEFLMRQLYANDLLNCPILLNIKNNEKFLNCKKVIRNLF